jgi:hypothetical protein
MAGRIVPGVPETNHLADQPTGQVIALIHSSGNIISRIKTKSTNLLKKAKRNRQDLNLRASPQ